MTFLADVNILSEATKPRPDQQVMEWLLVNESETVVDAIILAEIRYGILILPNGERRKRIEAWFQGGVRRLKCLAWDEQTGLRWAELMADLKARGFSLPVKDSQIAATALTYGLTVATRNVDDFARAGVPVVNPFE
jgi:predicted nucleic acid-binding protein